MNNSGLGHNCWFIALRDETEGRTQVQHTAGVRRHLEFWASRGREKGNGDHVQDILFRWHQAILQLNKWLVVAAEECYGDRCD